MPRRPRAAQSGTRRYRGGDAHRPAADEGRSAAARNRSRRVTDSRLAIVILAAGQGTRMKSETPKLLHTLAGIPIVSHVLATAREMDAAYTVAVVRHERDRLAEVIEEQLPGGMIVDQDEIPGTGRAVEQAVAALPLDFAGEVLVVNGDVPFSMRTRSPPSSNRTGRARRRRPCCRPCSTTPPGTVASCGMPVVGSIASSSTATPRQPNSLCPRSTLGSTSSVLQSCATRSRRWARRIHRARSTSPMSWVCCVPQAPRLPPCLSKTRGWWRASTTARSSARPRPS